MNTLKERLVEARGGEPLGSLLSSLIDRASKEHNKEHNISKDALIKKMADETGLQKGSVLRILKGKVKTPPLKRLEDFSKILNNYLK